MACAQLCDQEFTNEFEHIRDNAVMHGDMHGAIYVLINESLAFSFVKILTASISCHELHLVDFRNFL